MTTLPLRRPRVLVVEDELRLRELLDNAIPDMGFQTITARSAEEAHRLMADDPREIILLDLHLPGQNGMEWFAQLRRCWPTTQVIILSGYGDLDAARTAIHLDVVDFLTKPCRLHELEQALDRALRRIQSLPITTAPAHHSAPPASNLTTAASDEGEPLAGQDKSPALSGPRAASPVETLAESERKRILAALRRNQGNRTQTARELGISRRTLHYRLRDYGVAPGAITPDA